MLLFLDTEYTGLGQSLPKLISLALVAEDGSREFYVELDDTWSIDDCTDFVQREVLPLLSGPRVPRAEACAQLRQWLTSAPRAVTVACDSETDWRFLLGLIGPDRPSNLSDRYYDLRPLIDTPVYDSAVQAYYRSDDRMHHALADARAYQHGWLAWMDAKKTALPPELATWESAEPAGREFGAIATSPTILVVDVEATCAENEPDFDMEMIEVGAVWVATDGSVLDRFQSFVRPIFNPQLTPFCTQLTGITQADVDAAPLFPEVADALRAFVAKHLQAGSIWWTSWGAYDRRQFERDSARHGVSMPIAIPHENAKRLFAKAQRIGKEVGMARACALAGLPLIGAHHRALDDALNVARLLPWVLGNQILTARVEASQRSHPQASTTRDDR